MHSSAWRTLNCWLQPSQDECSPVRSERENLKSVVLDSAVNSRCLPCDIGWGNLLILPQSHLEPNHHVINTEAAGSPSPLKNTGTGRARPWVMNMTDRQNKIWVQVREAPSRHEGVKRKLFGAGSNYITDKASWKPSSSNFLLTSRLVPCNVEALVGRCFHHAI